MLALNLVAQELAVDIGMLADVAEIADFGLVTGVGGEAAGGTGD